MRDSAPPHTPPLLLLNYHGLRKLKKEQATGLDPGALRPAVQPPGLHGAKPRQRPAVPGGPGALATVLVRFWFSADGVDWAPRQKNKKRCLRLPCRGTTPQVFFRFPQSVTGVCFPKLFLVASLQGIQIPRLFFCFPEL